MPNARTECFLDTNVLIYAASGKTRDRRKFDIAYSLVLGETFGVSGQTLAEFGSVVRKKVLLSDEELVEWIGYLGAFPLVPVDQAYVLAGLAVARRFRIKYYDAALLAAAERLGASVFYSEDLNHGQTYGSVRVINPFLETQA